MSRLWAAVILWHPVTCRLVTLASFEKTKKWHFTNIEHNENQSHYLPSRARTRALFATMLSISMDECVSVWAYLTPTQALAPVKSELLRRTAAAQWDELFGCCRTCESPRDSLMNGGCRCTTLFARQRTQSTGHTLVTEAGQAPGTCATSSQRCGVIPPNVWSNRFFSRVCSEKNKKKPALITEQIELGRGPSSSLSPNKQTERLVNLLSQLLPWNI